MIYTGLRYFLLFGIFFVLAGASSCKNDESKVVSNPGDRQYRITVVNPFGESFTGNASVSGSDAFAVVDINTDVLDISFAGAIVNEVLTATLSDDTTSDTSTTTTTTITSSATIQFTSSRSFFTGSLIRTEGLYTFVAELTSITA